MLRTQLLRHATVMFLAATAAAAPGLADAQPKIKGFSDGRPVSPLRQVPQRR